MSALSFGDNLDALRRSVESGIIPLGSRRERAAQWRPGVEWQGSEGSVTTTIMPGEDKPDWSEVLRVFDLDPEHFDVVEPVLFNAWNAMGPEGSTQLMRQWKAKVIRRLPDSSYDISELVAEIKKFKPSSKNVAAKGDTTLVVVFSDWQIGKREGGGLEATVRRILACIDGVNARVRDMRKIGHDIQEIIVIGLGDLVEGVDGNYAMQTFSVDADRRDQVKIARRLVRDAIMHWSKLVPRMRVVAVAGNHGEHRKAGKAFTTFGDNDDVAIFEQVAEVLAANEEAFGHVQFAIPNDALSITLDVHGVILGVVHGHVAKAGQGNEMKLRRWLEKQSLGRQAIGDCDILVTGHYHSFRLADWGGIMWVQSPALDGGSDWWTAQTGDRSRSGMLTFLVTENGIKGVEII